MFCLERDGEPRFIHLITILVIAVVQQVRKRNDIPSFVIKLLNQKFKIMKLATKPACRSRCNRSEIVFSQSADTELQNASGIKNNKQKETDSNDTERSDLCEFR